MPEMITSFGTITITGNKICLEINPGCMGHIAVKSPVELEECFWDGTQWVCNSLSYGSGPSQSPDQSPSAV